MISAISIIIVLGGLILFHELGHFLMARAFGIGVSTFSLGFGPRLCGFKRGKTEYRLSLIPLGGYVAIVGESDESETVEGFSRAENFSLRPAWQRLLVIAFGPIANILVTLFICWGLAWSLGATFIQPVIQTVVQDSPAAIAGLKSGDVITSIDNVSIKRWEQIGEQITRANGKPVTILYIRAGVRSQAEITPEKAAAKSIFGEEYTAWRIGIQAAGTLGHDPLTFTSALTEGTAKAWEMLSLTVIGLIKMVQGIVPMDAVGGPILIAQLVGEQASVGLANVLALTAFISINLAVLNLLPIPVLDGGHIFFLLIEMLVKKPVSPRVRQATTTVGFFLLVLLMILATANDIRRIWM